MADNWSPTSRALSRIVNQPTSTRPVKKKTIDYDKLILEQQSKDPAWKRTIRNIGESAVDAGMGFLGLPQNQSKASGIGELTNAGLPFTAFGPKGIKQVFHGTPKAFDKFNPDVNNKGDVLGWMTHAAERPDYADTYATKSNYYPNKNNSRIIPIKPEANNVLDLVDPNADDISQALAFSAPLERKRIINEFKNDKRWLKYDPNSEGLTNFRHKYNREAPVSEHPIRRVAENLQLKPEVTENMPWDAIRYLDINEKSWAFPRNTVLKTPSGVPLNDAAEKGISSPIKMVRDDSVSTGMFPALTQPTGTQFDEWAKTGKLPAKVDPIKLKEKYKIGDKLKIIPDKGSSFNVTLKSDFDYLELQNSIDNGAFISKEFSK